MGDVKVSVCCLAFNHQPYIRQCLDGFVMQKCNFIFEVLIHDDASTDNTANIIKEYEAKYPEIIKSIYQTENQHSKGIKPTFSYNFPRCQGKYIALCEGDDYWTDPLKLQKQVDFLEENEDYNICFHKVKILNIKGDLVDDFITEERYEKIIEFPITQQALFKYSNFIHTPSVVFRNIIDNYPIEFQFTPVGDYLLYFMLSKNGYIHRIDEVMAVYRYGYGIYSKLSKHKKSIIGTKFQICLLSYTNSDEIKKSVIVSIFNYINFSETSNVNNLSIRDLLKIILKRIKKKIKKHVKKIHQKFFKRQNQINL